MPTSRFGAQELGIGEISPKMVEPQLEGDKDEDLGFTTLWQGPTLGIASYFKFHSFHSLLVFFSNGGYPRFLSLHLVVVGCMGV
jgi:hypothetical protein